MTAILAGVSRHLLADSVCVSLMGGDAEPPSMHLLAVLVASSEKCLFSPVAHFYLGHLGFFFN